MHLDGCYRILGLHNGASSQEVKLAYRALARQFHPDASLLPAQTTPTAIAQRQARFIQINQAYRDLMAHLQPPLPPVPHQTPPLLTSDQRLKQQHYQRLQYLFRHQQFPNAIALVEGLAQRFPQDAEIRQWQAITYQQWGRKLIQVGHRDRALPYFRKALRTDPHNRTLQMQIRQDSDRFGFKL
ncbi:MAG: J domain-containing protein [Synechococcales bacterium]|nr:J domain-containing protein [Synechococcales bacterium]